MKTFKVIGLLALIFLAGFAGGVVATRFVVRRMLAEAALHPTGAPPKVELTLDHKLHLTKEQREQIHEILKDSRERLRVVREEYQPQFNAIVLNARTNITSVLKPDQQARFQQFLADNRQFLQVRELPQPKKNQSSSTGGVEADIK
jgi:Spy/CpxP family protein refolding chaperone